MASRRSACPVADQRHVDPAARAGMTHVGFLVIGESLVDLIAGPGPHAFTAHAGGSPFNVAIGPARYLAFHKAIQEASTLDARWVRDADLRSPCRRSHVHPGRRPRPVSSGPGQEGRTHRMES